MPNPKRPTRGALKDDNIVEREAMVPEGLLPSYLAEAFADLYEEDGLLVMGKGLGWLSLLAVFVRVCVCGVISCILQSTLTCNLHDAHIGAILWRRGRRVCCYFTGQSWNQTE